MPRIPFSLCRKISRPAGRWLATRVGNPMPRLTYAPSGMSRATRSASSSRVRLFMPPSPRPPPPPPPPDRAPPPHEDAGRGDDLRIERAHLHQLADLRDGALRGGGHDGAEV